MIKHLLHSLIVLSLIGMWGCSSSKEEEVISAIDEALYHLSQSRPNCQKAIDALEEISGQNKNPRYIQTLASAYACRGGFSELQSFRSLRTIAIH